MAVQVVGIERMNNVKKSNVGIVVIDLNMQDMILFFCFIVYLYIYYWNRKNIVRFDYYNKYIIKKKFYTLYFIFNIKHLYI